jgi:hypothetical protein
MTKRPFLIALVAMLAVSFAACGSDSNSPSNPTPTPTPATMAKVTFFLDPPTVVANYEGGSQYAFKVNLGFHESAGVGFTITTIQATVSTTGGTVVAGDTYVSGHYVPGSGDYAVQYTMRFHTTGGRVPLVAKFTANCNDDKGNALTATTQVNVLKHGEPQRLP